MTTDPLLVFDRTALRRRRERAAGRWGDQAFLKREIATRLVDAGHEHLGRKGARRATALVGQVEQDAVRLWGAAGYRHDKQIARFVRNL